MIFNGFSLLLVYIIAALVVWVVVLLRRLAAQRKVIRSLRKVTGLSFWELPEHPWDDIAYWRAPTEEPQLGANVRILSPRPKQNGKATEQALRVKAWDRAMGGKRA